MKLEDADRRHRFIAWMIFLSDRGDGENHESEDVPIHGLATWLYNSGIRGEVAVGRLREWSSELAEAVDAQVLHDNGFRPAESPWLAPCTER